MNARWTFALVDMTESCTECQTYLRANACHQIGHFSLGERVALVAAQLSERLWAQDQTVHIVART